MKSKEFMNLDKIASSFFIKSDILYRTITFQNVAIKYSKNSLNQELHESLNRLREIIEKGSPAVPPDRSHNDLVMTHMPSLCFSSLISAYEYFIIEVCMFMSKMDLSSLDNVKVDYRIFRDLPEDQIIEKLVTEKISTLTFGSPKEYINKLCKMVCINKKTIEKQLSEYIEMKARRDTGVHNNWEKDARYIKTLEGINFTIPDDFILKPDLKYFTKTFNTCADMAKTITNNISDKILKEGRLFPGHTN